MEKLCFILYKENIGFEAYSDPSEEMKEKKIDITDRRKEENLFSREWAERVMLGLQIFQEFIDT